MGVEITSDYDRVTTQSELVYLLLKRVSEVVNRCTTKAPLLHPPFIFVPQGIRVLHSLLWFRGPVRVDNDQSSCGSLEFKRKYAPKTSIVTLNVGNRILPGKWDDDNLSTNFPVWSARVNNRRCRNKAVHFKNTLDLFLEELAFRSRGSDII